MKSIVLNQHNSMINTNALNNPYLKMVLFISIPLMLITVFYIIGNLKAAIVVFASFFAISFYILPKLLSDLRAIQERKYYMALLNANKPLHANHAHSLIKYFDATILRIDGRKNIIQIRVDCKTYKITILDKKK